MGEIRAASGDPAAAVECFDRALALNRNLPDSLFSRGNALVTLERQDEATASFRRTVELAPGDAEAHLNLANLLSDAGKGGEASKHFETALSIDPGFLAARVSRAAHYLANDDLQAAAEHYDHILTDHPDLFEALLGRGRTALKRGDLEDAGRFLGRAYEQRPDVIPLLVDLGEVNRRLGLFGDALKKYEAAARLDPDSESIQVDLATALLENDRVGDAVARLEWILERAPSNADAHCQLGIAHQRSGRFEAAAAELRAAISHDPEHAGALGALAHDKNQIDSDLCARIEGMLKKEGLVPESRATLHFALGSILDVKGRYEEAFGHFRAGNDIRRESVDFDVDRFRLSAETIIDLFDRLFFERMSGLGDDSDRPVFVVGMPRSGTTLVEQIIASHPDAGSAGELGTIRQIARDLGRTTPYPDCIAGLTAGVAAKQARRYLDVLTAVAPAAKRIVDKMPNNFVHLGLIAVLFPNARVVHCRRDPLDTGLSCYFHNFGVGVRYSYDLGKIGAYFRVYRRLMAHWRDALPMPVLDVQYESLVADPENESRRLIDFLGLEWDPACLSFYTGNRPVKTASLWQIRQPVYKTSIGRWRHYQSFLAPLMGALDAPTTD